MKKPIKEILVEEDCKDVGGFGISKGTKLFVMDILPSAPFGDHHRLMRVRVDNGTGHLDLCPETVVRDTEIKFKDVK